MLAILCPRAFAGSLTSSVQEWDGVDGATPDLADLFIEVEHCLFCLVCEVDLRVPFLHSLRQKKTDSGTRQRSPHYLYVPFPGHEPHEAVLGHEPINVDSNDLDSSPSLAVVLIWSLSSCPARELISTSMPIPKNVLEQINMGHSSV